MLGSQPYYAFVHIEKAAGTSLIHEIRKRFLFKYADVRPLFQRERDDLTAEDLAVYVKIIPALRFIGGHSVKPYSDIEQILPGIRYITVLRNPVDRVESHYTHWVQRKGYAASFDNFVAQCEMQNFMCKKISGAASSEAAKQVLKRKFIAVGVLEDLPGFYIQLSDQIPEFGTARAPRRLNTRTFEKVVSFSERERQVIEELNQEDIKLHHWVKNHWKPHSQRVDGAILPEPGRSSVKEYIEYLFRKLWVEPTSGAVRVSNGLSYKGSYQGGVYG